MQKTEGIEDLRVHRTRKSIRQAFIELTIEKGFAALTVRDITERAMMNRSTFYRHYEDKYDLLEQYVNEMIALFEDRQGGALLHSDEVPLNLVELLKHIQQFADFYRAMIGAKMDPILEQRFRQKMEKRILSCFDHVSPAQSGGTDAPPSDLLYNVTAAAGCGAIVWWLEQEQPYPPEQLAQWLIKLICDISASSLNQK